MAVSSVDSTTTSTQLAAANASRKGIVIANTDANDLYVLLGSGTASSTNYSFIVATDDEKAPPAGFTGEVVGVWAADGAGKALITEY